LMLVGRYPQFVRAPFALSFASGWMHYRSFRSGTPVLLQQDSCFFRESVAEPTAQPFPESLRNGGDNGHPSAKYLMRRSVLFVKNVNCPTAQIAAWTAAMKNRRLKPTS